MGTEVKEVPDRFFGGSGVKKACRYPEQCTAAITVGISPEDTIPT